MDTQPATRTTSLAELIEAVQAEGQASVAVTAVIRYALTAEHALRTGGQWFLDLANNIT